ncbi:site-specific DNA-methyltransferase [Phormidesmis priestleyi]|nr:site-specific DNA-methyltransferase [Phormidesmis priestleyi]
MAMATIHFKGKSYVQNHHLTLKYHHLVPNPVASLTDKISLHDNLIIHGDNLLALKALLPTYAGKVKCVYIDPPYNTGNEGWIYNDNVNSPMMQEWLKANQPIDKEDLARHEKWLCMMMPRLKLLRELLRDDGVIFISIDNNEVHRLRMLMDEIFDENNFIATIIWQKKQSPQNDATYLSDMHDYVLIYAKKAKETKNDPDGWERNLLPRSQEQEERYSNPDNDPRGTWTSVDYTCNKSVDERPNLYYPILNPVIGKEVYPSRSNVWRFDTNRHLKNEQENRVWWSGGIPRLKRFRSEVREGVVPSTWWDRKFAGDNQKARREIKKLFEELDNPFDSPKPVSLLKLIFKIATEDDSIILDSFAGSGTTAHAVSSLNQEDGGNRQFILVEMENYADSLTAERVRRVIQGVPNAKDKTLKDGLGGSFSFFELGDPIEMQAILEGNSLPAYEDLARYVFYTATGDEFDLTKVEVDRYFIGESNDFEVYLLYQPDLNYLRSTALDLGKAEKLGLPKPNSKKRLFFAPMKYLDIDTLERYRIEYCQLPFEIYKFKE